MNPEGIDMPCLNIPLENLPASPFKEAWGAAIADHEHLTILKKRLNQCHVFDREHVKKIIDKLAESFPNLRFWYKGDWENNGKLIMYNKTDFVFMQTTDDDYKMREPCYELFEGTVKDDSIIIHRFGSIEEGSWYTQKTEYFTDITKVQRGWAITNCILGLRHFGISLSDDVPIYQANLGETWGDANTVLAMCVWFTEVDFSPKVITAH